MSNKFEPADSSGDSDEFENEEGSENEESDSSLSDVPPVLRSIVTKGVIDSTAATNNEEAEREAIKQELSALSFEELQKLKEKLGSKKFNKALSGKTTKKPIESEEPERSFKRANKNRPREMSSKKRKIEPKPAFQVPKVFRNDPRFDSLCGEFNEKKFNRNYEFVYKIKEEEVAKLKEELKEENDPKKIEKLKYLIQRLENQIRAEKKRKEEADQKLAEQQVQIEAMKQGKSPYFASKAAKREKTLKEKFDKLKDSGKLESYMAKRRRQNAKRDKKFLPKAT